MVHKLYKLSVATYFRKTDIKLGLKILLEDWPLSQMPQDFLDWWQSHRHKLTQNFQSLIDQDIKFTFPGDLDYPTHFLKNLENPPLLLFYIGSSQWVNGKNLGVVGSRKINILTKQWINDELVPFLEKNAITIVSGGARGVDQASHFAALRAKRPTVVFLPSGLQQIYPKELNEWKEEILKSGGALVSEYWPDELIRKHHFLQRNRLIAAFADVVLIAQGERRSGTLLTAKWAIDLGQTIVTVPGHPADPSFSGNLELLRDGVPPVIDVNDLGSLFL